MRWLVFYVLKPFAAQMHTYLLDRSTSQPLTDASAVQTALQQQGFQGSVQDVDKTTGRTALSAECAVEMQRFVQAINATVLCTPADACPLRLRVGAGPVKATPYNETAVAYSWVV